MGGVLRQPLLLHEQLQSFKTPASGLDAVTACFGAGLVEDRTHAQGLQEAAPRNAVGEALDRDRRPDAADISLASFEAVERNGDGSRKAELGASHEGLRGSDWTLKTGADAGCVLTLSSPAFTPSRLPLSLCLPLSLHDEGSVAMSVMSASRSMVPPMARYPARFGWRPSSVLTPLVGIAYSGLSAPDRRLTVARSKSMTASKRPLALMKAFSALRSSSLAPNSGLPRAGVSVAPMTLMAGAADRSARTPDVIACSSSFRLAWP